MAVRITTYQQAFNVVLGMEITDKVRNLISQLESEGHTEKSIAYTVWRTQDKLNAYKYDNRFLSIFRNEVNKWSWPKDDSRWQEYWNKKNEEKKAAAIRREIDKARERAKLPTGVKFSPKQKGYVYFIQGQCGGAIKIGYSVKPEERIKSLQTGYPDTLVMLAMIPGSESIERKLHKEFESCRLNGEWFRPDQILIDKIKELQAVC